MFRKRGSLADSKGYAQANMPAMVIPLIFLALTEAMEVLVVVSSETPDSIVSMLQELSPLFGRLETFYFEKDVSQYNHSIILDYLYNAALSTRLQSSLGSASEYVNMWRKNNDQMESQQLASAATQFADYVAQVNLTEVVLISDTQEFNLRVTAYAIDDFPSHYRQRVVIPSDSSQAFCHQFVGRTIKPRGIRFVALFTNELVTAFILSALRTHKMDREGHAVVLSEEASFYRYVNSSSTLKYSQLLVVAEKTVEVKYSTEVQRLRLLDFLTRLKAGNESMHSDCTVSNPSYNLYLVQGSSALLLSPNSTDLRYANWTRLQQVTSQLSKLPKIPIDISVNYDLVEQNGAVVPSSITLMRGIQVAVEEINTKQTVIPDYLIRDNSLGFTGLTFDFNVTRQRVLKNRKSVGLIHMAPPIYRSVQGLLAVLQSLNMTVPMSAICTGADLSDRQKYPLFLRPVPTNEYSLKIVCRIMISFGWKRLAVLYQADNAGCEEAYSIFTKLAAEYYINITNPEENRAVPYTLNTTASEAVNASLAAILYSNAQVLLIISLTPHITLQQMYDAGFRQDHAVLMLTGLTGNFYTGPQYYRQRVVSKGAFMLYPRLFVGRTGKKVQEQLIRYDNSSYFSNTCLSYDSAMLYFHATDFLLERGRDFEDPRLIVETMRKTRFQGCSGLVQIDPDSNDRASGEIAISNFHYDSDTDTYEIKVVGSYNPYISEPLHIQWDEIQWPNGESSFSDYKPKYRDCDYLARGVISSSIGQVLASVCCFGLVCLVAIAGFCIWKGKLKRKVSIITQKFHASQQDVFCMVATVLDFFVLASTGPSTTQIRTALHGVFTLFFDELLDSESEVYWQRYYCALSVAVWWVLLRRLKHCKKQLFFASLISINDYFTPFVTRVCFMLFAVPLLQVFVCSKGRSEQLGESILDTDCHTTCWSKLHIIFSIISGFVFFAFSLDSLAYELNFTEESKESHIRLNTLISASKHTLRLVVAASFASLRAHSPEVHAYIHLASVSLYFAVSTFLTETSYARLNLWSAAVHFAVVLMSLTAFISRKVSQHSVPMVVYALFVVYGLMLTGVCIVQWKVPKYESKLLRRRGLDIRHLLEFGFTAGERAQTALKQYISEKSVCSDGNQQFELEI